MGTKKCACQKKICVPKSFGSNKILGPKKFCVQKKLRFKKNFGSERILGHKSQKGNFGQKKWAPKNLGNKNVVSQKKVLGPKKILSLKKLWADKKFVVQKF